MSLLTSNYFPSILSTSRDLTLETDLAGRRTTVDAFTPYLAEIHRQNLLDEAAAARLASTVRTSRPSVSAWRRGLGSLFASMAGTLDPSIDPTTARRTASRSSGAGSGARALAS
jgi:hypothetical protein